MNFTREPVIETVITPRDGAKLLVRPAQGGDAENYLVDAVEVVIFGGAVFYRSTSRPIPFLVPVGEYEVIETRGIKTGLKKPIERHGKGLPLREVNVASGESPSFSVNRAPQKPSSPARSRQEGRRGGNVRREIESEFPEEKDVECEEPISFVSDAEENIADRASKILAALIPAPHELVSDTLTARYPKASVSHPHNLGSLAEGDKPVMEKRRGGRFDRTRGRKKSKE